MLFLRDFPVKEITLKLLLVLALIVTFKTLAEKNNTPKKVFTKDKIVAYVTSKETNQTSEQKLSEAEKFNTEIELLCYLLDSRKEGDNALFEEILFKLEDIEKEAKKKNLETLISADIYDLQKKVEIYKQQVLGA